MNYINKIINISKIIIVSNLKVFPIIMFIIKLDTHPQQQNNQLY